MLNAVPAIVLEDVGVSPCAITLVVEGSRRFERRDPPLFGGDVIPREVHARVTHSDFVHSIQAAVIRDDVTISPATCAKVVHVLWIESSTHLSER